jgi:hypothetical protein
VGVRACVREGARVCGRVGGVCEEWGLFEGWGVVQGCGRIKGYMVCYGKTRFKFNEIKIDKIESHHRLVG